MSEKIIGGGILLPESTVTAKNLQKIPFYIPDETNIKGKSSQTSEEKSDLTGGGFYYNEQLRNPLISVSLHVNTETTDGGITWEKASGDKDDTPGEWPYKVDALFRAILNEDYQTAISNSWSEFGDDAIGSLFNQFKPYAPYLGHLSKAFKQMNAAEEGMKISGDRAISSTFGRIMDKVTDVLQGVADEGAQILNRSLIVQGARFSYYSGTGVGFGNLTMKFTVFADWDDAGNFLSVDSQLQPLYPYCFGKFVKLLDEKGNVTGVKEDGILNKAVQDLNIVQANKDDVNKFFGWQLPPGGFEADVRDIDLCQKGTLKLKFGTFYAIDNLVISDAQFNFSRQMVKNWNKGTGENDISPLSCDVVLTFKPASKFTDNKLYDFISGRTMSSERNKTEEDLRTKLEDEKKSMKNYLEGYV